MLLNVTSSERSDLLASIELGFAVKIEAASFVDGSEQEFHIDFFAIDGRVFRREYNARNTMTAFQEVVGDDLDLFGAHYGARA